MVPLGISMSIPLGTYGRVAPRSGLGKFPPRVRSKSTLGRHGAKEEREGEREHAFSLPVQLRLSSSITPHTVATRPLLTSLLLFENSSASKHSLSTGAGVIDSDYRGPVFVLLFNHSDADFTVEAGDRVAQLILEKVEYSEVVEVEVRSLFLFLFSLERKTSE